MKQYKDELLASCLTFVLSLHHNIIAQDIKAYCPALEVKSFVFILFGNCWQFMCQKINTIVVPMKNNRIKHYMHICTI